MVVEVPNFIAKHAESLQEYSISGDFSFENNNKESGFSGVPKQGKPCETMERKELEITLAQAWLCLIL